MLTIHSDKRKSGISLIGDLPWGTPVCQFYQTREDLLEILVPYFRAGLENNEFCLWITSKPLGALDVKKALKEALPHFETYREKGQIEIISRGRWHGRRENAIVSSLDHAILAGFDGLRLACSVLPEKKGGRVSVFCEETDAIARHNVIAVFAYPRDEFDAVGLMEVVKNHRFVIVRNAGRWEVIESSEARVIKDALRRSEEKFYSLFSNMAEGFAYHRIVLDGRGEPCDYVFLEVNDSFERLTGLKGKDIIGKKVTEVLPGIEKDPADWIGKYGKVALTGNPVRFESYSEPLKRWYSVSAFSPHKGYFAVTFSDITASKKAEEALRESEERWATTLASIGDAVISTDVESRITFMNAVAEALTGWRLAEACKRPVTEVFNVIHEQTRRKVENPVSRVLQEGGIVGLANHTVLLRKDGTEVPIDDSGAPIRDRNGKTVGVVLVFRDITGRKEAETNQILLTDILQTFNRGGDLHPVIGETLRLIRQASGFDAVGLRLRQNEDCPYFESNGFSEEFVREENFLCAKGGDGAIVQDAEGRAELECTCGLVLSGRTDPGMSCFTRGGSFWTNVSSELLALPPEADPRTNPRNRCIHTGYESVGLFPVRSGREIIGLLQLNDHQAGRFTPGMVAFYEALAQNIGLALQRVTAEEALRESETKYRTLFENMAEEVHFWQIVRDEAGRIKTWRLVDTNPPTLKTWGRSTVEEIRGKTTDEIFGPGATDHYMPVVQKIMTEGVPYSFEDYFPNLDKYFRFTSVPLGDYFITTGADITGIKKVEAALRKAHDELEIRVQERTAELRQQSKISEGFFKSTITPLVFLDRNFNFIRVNEAYAKACQREISEFEGHNHFEFYPHEENEAIFKKVVETKVPYQAIAKPFSFPDHPEWGTTYWDWTLTPLLDDKGEVEFLVFALDDVTQRKRAELALHEASLYGRSLIEASIDPLVTISRDGKIMDVNGATELATGITRDALIGTDFSDYFAEPEKAREGYRQVFSKGSVRDYPLAIRHTSGRIMEVLYNATTYKNEAGEVQGVFAAARDITMRKRAEEALREAHDQVRFFASQCLTAQETERRRIAGELHDSVAASLGALRFRIDKIAEEMKQGHASFESMRDLSSKVVEINNDTRRIMAALRPSILDDLGIVPAMNWFCREYEKTYSHISVEKEIDVSENDLADPLKTAIFRVSQEAMNNIAKYSKATVVTLTLQKENDGIELAIRDNGQGFDLNTIVKGLGLSTMKERTELSGGTYSIESVKGAGTTIRCTWLLT